MRGLRILLTGACLLGICLPARATDLAPPADAALVERAARGEQVSFRDCPVCPEMVVIPAGSFEMGSRNDNPDRAENEAPAHRVSVAGFALGKYEVTFAQWDACVADGGCEGYVPADLGWGRGTHPVINVSWKHAQAYVQWLSRRTGRTYRLPSEAEWEYAARAGSRTAYHWGDQLGENRANCNRCGSRWDGHQSAPVGSFPPNAFGLHDMLGNVWEWVDDCWHPDYQGAPADGRTWVAGDCRSHGLRGGSWLNDPAHLRLGFRGRFGTAHRDGDSGFRVVRVLSP